MGGCQSSAGLVPGTMLLTPPVDLGMGMRGRRDVHSSPLLLPVSLHRKTKHLCLSWHCACPVPVRVETGEICVRNWDGTEDRVCSSACASSSLTDRTGTHVEPHTRIRAARCLVGLQSQILAHTDFTICQQSLLILQKLLFSLLLFHCSPREHCSV